MHYKRGSNYVPPTSMQSLHRRFYASYTWPNKCSCLARLSIAPWTRAIRSSSDVSPILSWLSSEMKCDSGPEKSVTRMPMLTSWFFQFLSLLILWSSFRFVLLKATRVRVALTGSPSAGLPSEVTEVSLSANPLVGSQVVVCQVVGVDSLVQASVGLGNPGCKKVLQLTDFAWSE